MPIERLLQPNINARDFNPAEERPRNSLERRYGELKKRLCDKDGQWVNMFYGNRSSRIETRDQLVGIWAEAQFDKDTAQKQYEALKRSSFYSRFRDRWKHLKDNKEKSVYAEDQLLGVIVENLFDREKAKTQYAKLKRTKQYNETTKDWYEKTYLGKPVKEYSTSVSYQLLGIIAGEMFGDKQTKDRLEQISDETEYDRPLRIIAMSLFDKKLAREQYNAFKQTAIYTKTMDLEEPDENIFGEPALLLYDVIAEVMLEEKNFAEDKPIPVPEVRIF